MEAIHVLILAGNNSIKLILYTTLIQIHNLNHIMLSLQY